MSNQHDMQPAPLRQRRVIRVYNNLQDTRRLRRSPRVTHYCLVKVTHHREQHLEQDLK